MDDKLVEQSEHEEEFFNKEYEGADRKQEREEYLIPSKIVSLVTPKQPNLSVDRQYAAHLLGEFKGRKLLDYGAGDGWTAVCFAKAGAKVWAMDISRKGIELVRKKAAANGVSDSVIAEVGNCYETNYSKNMFDLIYGGGILHHLDLAASGAELNRILKSDGVAVFCEPIRETRIMDIIRSMVLFIMRKSPAEDTTEDEEPLTKKKIMRLKSYFKTVNVTYFNVLSSANSIINNDKAFDFLNKLDNLLKKIVPGFEKLGRTVVIELSGPIKPLVK